MMEWIRLDQPYDNLPQVLKESSPEFALSPEANTLSKQDWALPGAVLATWGRFIARMFSEDRLHALPVDERKILERQFDILEELCAGDPEISNAVWVEIFEHLHEDAEWHRDFSGRLRSQSRRIYDLATKSEQ